MKRRLFITNTLFQIMTVINLNNSLLSDGNNDIFITDCSVGADVIADNIRTLGIFRNVYYVKTASKIQTKTLKDKCKRFFEYFFNGKGMYNTIVPEIDYSYDELLFYNYDSFVNYVFNRIQEKNALVSWSRFEEGYISYFFGSIESRIVIISEAILRILNKKSSMYNHCDSYYFYEPKLVIFKHGQYNIKQIPKIDRENANLVNTINSAFGVSGVPDEYKNVKFIFFEEQFCFDDSGVEDFDLINRICDIVGHDNILVKTHPRNRTNRFLKTGIKTNKTVGIPWEVIHLNHSFEDKVFIAISCGSILSSKILFSEHVKSILLYKCVNKTPPLVTKEYEEYISRIKELYGNDFIIPESLDELEKVLIELKG